MVGWDEILRGGLAPNATVMSWHGTTGGLAAARSGHDVIMTPSQEVYFDYAQGQRNLEPPPMGWNVWLSRVYGFEAAPPEMTREEAGHVLGSQGCVWGEFITGPKEVEYMTYPRAMALGEALWSPRERKSWPDFARRMEGQLERLDRLGINYARSAFDVWIGQTMDQDRNEDRIITFSTEVPGQEIRYTLDGSDPVPGSPRAEGLVHARAETTVKAATFKNGRLYSKVSVLVVR